MIAELVLGLVLGLSGLVAFLHTNFVLQLSSVFLPQGFSKSVFASSLSFSKIVFELVPTLFFIIPSTSFGVSLLPSQKLLLEGKAFKALKLTIASFLIAGACSILLLPLVLMALPLAYSSLAPFTGFVLLAFTILSFASKERFFESTFAFLLSGVLGLVLLSKPVVSEPLFPLLSGLFGVPALLFSLDSQKPVVSEENAGVECDVKIIFLACVFGSLSSLLPAVTPMLLVAVLFLLLEGRESGGRNEELVIQAGAAALVSKTFFDFVAFQAIGKARSGAVAFASSELHSLASLGIALAAGLVSLFIACAVMLLLYPRFARLPFEGKSTPVAVLCFIVLACVALNGLLGLLVLGVSACTGVAISLLGVRKTTSLGCLIVPSLCFFFSISIFA